MRYFDLDMFFNETIFVFLNQEKQSSLASKILLSQKSKTF